MTDRFAVRAPVDGFTGTVAGVLFTGGAAETSDPVAVAYFRRRGYRVSRVSAPEPTPAPAARPKPYDPKQRWVDYAVAQGAPRDVAESLTKRELIGRYGA